MKKLTIKNNSMDFEYSMRQFFGDKAYHISDYENKQETRKWLLKALKKMMKDIHNLDTTTRHKERLLDEIKGIEKSIKEKSDPWNIIYRFFKLCSRFLGYDWLKGISYHTPFYYQVSGQYYWSKAYTGEDFTELIYKNNDNTLVKQKELIRQLQKEKYNDFQIGLILGLSEYKVKKMKKEI